RVRVDQLDAIDDCKRLRSLPDRLDRNRAVAADRETDVRRHRDRPALAHDQVTRAVREQSSRIDAKIAGARVRFAPALSLHRQEASALYGDIELPSGTGNGSFREVGAVRIHYGVDARVRANSLDRHRTESVQVGSETGRRDVREIIAVDRLRKLGLLCAGHRQVNHLVHVVSLFPSGASHYWMLMTVCVTVSAVEIICAFAWKFRCDVIICTSCAVRSTFDASSAPDWMLPNDAVPASPSKTSPDAKDSPQAVSPTCCKPCGLAKLASASLPRAVDWPFVKRAKTMPSPSTLTPVSRPVVKPSCDREFTPNALPNCVVE